MAILYGLDAVAKYVGRHRITVHRWIRDQAFPCSMDPNGTYMTSTQLIDQWILARARAGIKPYRYRNTHTASSRAADALRQKEEQEQ